MTKKLSLFLLLTILLTSTNCFASTYVKGYMRKNGTYVQGHFKSNADSYKFNNYSTKGNLNPYTGKTGTVPYKPYKLKTKF